jgi:hypothetical protein
MSIKPPSDLIIDVMRQADPVRAREAAERLTAIGRSAKPAAAPVDFSTYVKSAIFEATAGERKAGPQAQLPLSLPQGDTAGVRAESKMSPGEQLEAFVLTSLIETMMPKDAESVFGSGTAGSYWRSMLAEKLAAELTMAGGVGLREQLKLREIDKPDATEALRAILDSAKIPAEMAESTDALGLSAFGRPRTGEIIPARLNELPITKPESNGA